MADKLTLREIEVVTWVAIGKTDWEIATILALSHKTVNFHVEKVKRKLGCSSRIAMVCMALRDGLIPFPAHEPAGGAMSGADGATQRRGAHCGRHTTGVTTMLAEVL